MADFQLTDVPTGWVWRQLLLKNEYPAADGSIQTNYRVGSRYGLTLNYDVRVGEELTDLHDLVESIFWRDKLIVRLKEDLQINQDDVAITVRTNTNARATTIPITSAGNLPSKSYVQIGNGVYRTTEAITARSSNLTVKWPIRQAVSANDVISTQPRLRMEGRGDAPDLAVPSTDVTNMPYGPVSFTVWEVQ